MKMSKYYGVVGNRDYIKVGSQKRPYWEFLDRQPDGYLTSAVYARKDLPNTHTIFDCGAWSYRNEDSPAITPESALIGYTSLAKPGDFLIAPDHMLIDGVDLDARRDFNRESARRFIELCPKEFRPMVTVHGMDLEERMETGEYMEGLGYQHMAIGGIAARASQKKLVSKWVFSLRQEFPDLWLHVLGLSSPDYAGMWQRWGVDSFDGSSHFKQAFTGGAFFTLENWKLKKHQAARPDRGEIPTAPLCDCLACEILRGENVDTRRYGSNEHNMGRAAHNQNMLMKAQGFAMNGVTVLVSCVGEKASEPTMAENLYQSTWFKKAREYAKTNGDRWYILSAKYGLVKPDRVLRPYEKTLNAMTKMQRVDWGMKVSAQINATIPSPSKIVILAGRKYREFLDLPNYLLETPLSGMGIGQQLSWFNQQTHKQGELFK